MGGGKHKRTKDHFRPLDLFRPENKEDKKLIIEVKNKRAADYTNFSNDLFRPLPENKVEEDSIKEVKRDSEEKRSAQGEFHRAVVFKPSGKRQGLGKRSDECATNSPTV